MFVALQGVETKLLTHVGATLCHNNGVMYSFIDFNEIPHDSNYMLTCISNCLILQAEDGSLPPKLCIQLDNTSKENKHKYGIGFFGYLTMMGIFKEVSISSVGGHMDRKVVE